ncbi:MAG: hypothetical protein ABJH63_14050 [Rhizobiaceae bacterium]
MSAEILDNIAYLRAAEKPVHTLLVGAGLESASNLFQRKVEVVRCEHTTDLESGLEQILAQAKQRPFDCVMVDMRDGDSCSGGGGDGGGDGGGEALSRDVLRIASTDAAGHLVVLANEQNCQEFNDMLGVTQVLVAPIQPIDIVKTIVAAAPQPSLAWSEGGNEPASGAVDFQTDAPSSPSLAPTTEDLDRKQQDESAAAIQPTAMREGGLTWWTLPGKTNELREKIAPKLEQLGQIDQGVWQKFVPLVNFVYKKLAIVLLTALFLTFVAYGAMIVFFMTNDNWSMPFQLSRGHVLVEKVERDLSSLNLRRNQLRQDLTVATAELKNARRSRRDGKLQLLLTRRTIEQEIWSITAERNEVLNQIARLNKIVADFKRLAGNNKAGKNLQASYEKRLITKSELNRSSLALLETLHRLAVFDGEIATKKLSVRRNDNSLTFLNSLLVEINQPQIRSVESANSDLAPLAREVINNKTQVASAETALESARLRSDQLENSFEVISANLSSLQQTPAARAMIAPVTVLFVPYDNADSVEMGDPLYGCGLTIIGCYRVGEVGKVIEGETTAVHPLFGKPMRGVFVEAKFDSAELAESELVHAGSSPLWF